MPTKAWLTLKWNELAELFARSASCDVTPRDRPVRLAGYASRTAPVCDILDAIEISAILLESPPQRCLIFSFDLMVVGSELQDMILSRLQRLGFEADEAILLTSHTHCAPATDRACARLGIPDDQFVRELAEAASGLVRQMQRARPSEIRLELLQVLDLDNTMWGGIVGDDGIEGLALGSGSPLGEAHAALQRMALSLKARGIILCVSSKNDEAIALDAFRNHPEMILKDDDIVVFRVNWDDKAANIRAISDAIDLGLDSFVFLDDNPAERKRVRDALPAVAVPELPDDPSDWLTVFQAAGYFEQASFSKEDQLRAGFYKANARRAAQMERIGNHDEYLLSLGMPLSIAPFDGAGRKRIAQLISKSNQFNLTTRRYSETEIAAMQSAPDVFAIQARLEDIFGDNGMISAVICRQTGSSWEVDTWIMSYRVPGRRVEEALLQHLVQQARLKGITEIIGRYIPTARNGLVRDHFSRLDFIQTGAENDETTWRLDVGEYSEKTLPLRVDHEPEWNLAAAARS